MQASQEEKHKKQVHFDNEDDEEIYNSIPSRIKRSHTTHEKTHPEPDTESEDSDHAHIHHHKVKKVEHKAHNEVLKTEEDEYDPDEFEEPDYWELAKKYFFAPLAIGTMMGLGHMAAISIFKHYFKKKGWMSN